MWVLVIVHVIVSGVIRFVTAHSTQRHPTFYALCWYFFVFVFPPANMAFPIWPFFLCSGWKKAQDVTPKSRLSSVSLSLYATTPA